METTVLSQLDQVAIRGRTNLIWFFGGSNHSGMIRALQMGLFQISSEIPFLTSDIVAMDGTSQKGKLGLRASKRALVLEVNDLTANSSADGGLDFEKLRNDNFPPSSFKNVDFLPVLKASECSASTGMPVIAMQANLLVKGLALAVSFHHAAFDGGSWWPYHSKLLCISLSL